MAVPVWAVAPAVLVAALLYSTVGHGGASAYLAILILAGHAPSVVAPIALVLNVGVAGVAWIAYRGEGHFSWRLLLPFAAASIPAAFVGGRIQLPDEQLGLVLAVAFVVVGVRFLVLPAPRPTGPATSPPHVVLALVTGAALGLVAGLTGIGGGVLLTPLVILAGWARPKTAAGVSAAFIVLNSLAGLAGQLSRGASIDAALLAPLLVAALVGGVAGAWMGARRLPAATLQRALGVVLLLAAARALA